MTDLDALDLFTETPATPTGAGPRKCRRHDHQTWDEATDEWICRRCGHRTPVDRVRRGRSSRRLGNDQERRAERLYGWRKVGEFGGVADLEDAMFVVQQKATRGRPPIRWVGIFAALESHAAGRTPLLLLSFVANGKPTVDYVVVRGEDWRALHRGEVEP